jgi:hypothetical protein
LLANNGIANIADDLDRVRGLRAETFEKITGKTSELFSGTVGGLDAISVDHTACPALRADDCIGICDGMDAKAALHVRLP